jgi:hypothetical protein
MNKIFIFACFLLLSHEKEKNTFLGNNNSNMGIASSKILVGSGSVRFNSRNTNNGELNLKDLNKIKSTSNLVNKTIEIFSVDKSELKKKYKKFLIAVKILNYIGYFLALMFLLCNCIDCISWVTDDFFAKWEIFVNLYFCCLYKCKRKKKRKIEDIYNNQKKSKKLILK